MHTGQSHRYFKTENKRSYKFHRKKKTGQGELEETFYHQIFSSEKRFRQFILFFVVHIKGTQTSRNNGL